MKTIKVIKFKPMKEQTQEADFSLDESLIPFWHVIQETGDGEFTACGMATPEYNTEEKIGKVTCPDCLETIKFFKDLGR